jgi:hypothetical protein
MNIEKKSRVTSFILTLLLGPLGLLYSSVVAGIILIVLALFSAPTLIGPVVCWILSICIGDQCTYNHNKNVDQFVRLISANRA